MKPRLIISTVALAATLSLFGSAALASTSVSTVPQATATEASALQYMREEEKLARDVYSALSAKWNTPIFRNIARSEQRHMDAVKLLLDRYGIPDPANGAPAGSFEDPRLQALYTKLVQQGSRSVAAAMGVGVQIENLDIADLQSRLAQTDKTDIRFVFTQLQRGSSNHLRAFQHQL